MNFNKPIKYKDILIFVILFFIGYKIVDNYPVYLSILKKFLTLLTPFLYALIFAYILNPLMKLIERKLKLKRCPAVGLTYLIILGILIIIGIYGIPSIIDSIISITKEIPSYINTTQDWINSILKNDKFYELMKDAGVLQTLTSLSTKAGNIFVYILDGTINSLLSITSNILMFGFGFLISIYMLLDKEKFIKQAKLLIIIIMGKKQGTNILNIGKVYNHMIGSYIGIKAIDSLIIGIISLIGLFMLDIPYYILLAALVGFTNMIPYFGPFVSMVLCALVAVFISPSKAFAVIIFLLALQQFDAWYLEPKLVSGKVGLNPFLIILGVTIGGGFFGPIGMILASPTIATLKIYYDKFINNYNPPLNT
ncbi:AI-2E family transporter [Clostridium sardiniense]|uniref:AI-2E family transporter n=1 Tax=Clostridium sardiniense TaxID=29369 RepID=A0ABS7L1J9_CLOSR|nr:AI-2E family transporter [Clostridium sardiniense]MBY0756934.1 AI-2E family transporter [Clostridium sardiniense]MBY0756958.1 AI-2E family transporter [Clostridium sardiniense]MDQ0460352.1 putative PurR-regulated permease PerM [Clostridium sardiniense]